MWNLDTTTMILPTLHINFFHPNRIIPTPEEIIRVDPKLYRRRSVILGDTSRSQARLSMSKKLFSSPGTCTPILSAPSSQPFLDLQVTSLPGGIVLGRDGFMETPVAVVAQFSKHHFVVFSTRPVYFNQKPVKHLKIDLYAYATVKPVGQVLHVFLEQESSDEPAYTIHSLRHVSHRSHHLTIQHIIKQHGFVVASTRYTQEDSYMLAVSDGVDACFMILLAAIADQLDQA